MHDIALIFTYVVPEKYPIMMMEMKKIFTIKSVYPEAKIFLAGDLNAETKEFLDYIPNDDLDLVFGDTDYPNDTFNINRNSKDINIYNRFGFSLINMCCENAYDLDGYIICISNKGKSLVDYIIA